MIKTPDKYTKSLNNYQLLTNLLNIISETRETLKNYCLEKLSGEKIKKKFQIFDQTHLEKFVTEYKIFLNIEKIPIYYLIDNADYGCDLIHKNLNNLIKIRSYNYCLKIAIQRGKIWNMSDLDVTHDYIQFNIDEINTNTRSIYMRKIENITWNRLKSHGINKSGYDFFPTYVEEDKLEKEIDKKLRIEYRKKYQNESDTKKKRTSEKRYVDNHISKYKRVELFRQCTNKRYSYAGFKNLIQISSGVVRQFLSLAFDLYAGELKKTQNKNTNRPKIESIPYLSQKDGIQKFSDNLLLSNTLKKIEGEDIDETKKQVYNDLYNLIEGMGTYFNYRLYKTKTIQECSFSFTFYGEMDMQIKDLINLGIIENLFQTQIIADGGTKMTKYSINRGLCPRYLLDLYFKSSISLTNDILKEMIKKGNKYQINKNMERKLTSFVDLGENDDN
jgi:hypothetical protein